jgi:hypothetical protein
MLMDICAGSWICILDSPLLLPGRPAHLNVLQLAVDLVG